MPCAADDLDEKDQVGIYAGAIPKKVARALPKQGMLVKRTTRLRLGVRLTFL